MRRTLAGIIATCVVAVPLGCETVIRAEGPGPPGGGPPCDNEAAREPFYSTGFPVDELPISEGGAWSRAGASWTPVQTQNGVAHGTQTGQGGFDDSYARLSGFPPDQQACAVIHKDSSGGYGEVEVLLRWSDTSTSAKGYEAFMHTNGMFAKIVRWNGGFGDFTSLAHVDAVRVPQDGDILRATAVGDVITLYLNDELLVQATDPTFPTGDPGMGFYKDAHGGPPSGYGFSGFTATGY
ncbi:hypothetical protein H7J88_23260 [Mycolicibacterium flavescens]|uniref:Uncharacterized protein n=1 Tax=Mycolicibacterium flavescens TaxID=1776 RepID=A0A1E3RL77_MYCFV|nr:hypothetical protein [Mycolicibacterium flavescens]MCV7282558.1 hypothetical protein [Mycolicibacterium flavescens]ODQ90182.1 hypothetical protein BHQ18_12175 [Mycolicibacterium flavescens]